MSSSPASSSPSKKKKKKKKKKNKKLSKEDREADQRQRKIREKEKRFAKEAAGIEAAAKEEDPYPAAVRSKSLTLDEIVQILDRPYGKPKVTTLDLSGSKIGDEATGRIANHMKKNGRSIEYLELCECSLAARSAVRLAPAILATRSLISLNLSRNSIGDRGLEVMCGAMLGNSTIKHLNLRETKLGARDGWIGPLCEVISAKKNLTSLDLSDNLMGRADAEALALAMQAPACQLACLRLNQNPLCGLGVEHLALAISGGAVTTLTELGLTSVEMDSRGAAALADAIASPNCNIAVLHMDCNPNVGHKGVTALAATALKRTSCPITTLRLGNIGLRRKIEDSPDTSVNLKKMGDKNKILKKFHLRPKAPHSHLQRELPSTAAAPVPQIRPFVEHALYAPVVNIQDSAGQNESKAVGAAMTGSKAVKESTESKIMAGEDSESVRQKSGSSNNEGSLVKDVAKVDFNNGFDALGYALTQNTTLTMFDLSGAREIDDDGVGPIASAIGRSQSLKVVNLSGNCIGDEGACLLADALEDNPVGPLHTLDLHNNCIGDEGAVNIAEVIGVDNKSLTSLDMRSQRSRMGGDNLNPVPIAAPMDTDGVMAFATMLKTNCTLTSLDLRGNGILDLERTERVVETDAFAKAALRAVVYNPKACILHIYGTDLSRVARSCHLPEEYHARSPNEDREGFNLKILRYAHRMDL